MLNLRRQDHMDTLIRGFLAAHPPFDADRQRCCVHNGLPLDTLMLASDGYVSMAEWGRQQGLIDQEACTRLVTVARRAADAHHNQQQQEG